MLKMSSDTIPSLAFGMSGRTGCPPVATRMCPAVTVSPVVQCDFVRALTRGAGIVDGNARAVEQIAIDALPTGRVRRCSFVRKLGQSNWPAISATSRIPAPWRPFRGTRTAKTISFFGTQPRITQVPPMRLSSARATFAPVAAAVRAARTPPEPPPMTKRSTS